MVVHGTKTGQYKSTSKTGTDAILELLDTHRMSLSGCEHVGVFKALKGTQPYRIVLTHFVWNSTGDSVKRKVKRKKPVNNIHHNFPFCLVARS